MKTLINTEHRAKQQINTHGHKLDLDLLVEQHMCSAAVSDLTNLLREGHCQHQQNIIDK